jgi:hypothetical protein
VLRLNISLDKSMDVLRRRPGFQVSSLLNFRKGTSAVDCEQFKEMCGIRA